MHTVNISKVDSSLCFDLTCLMLGSMEYSLHFFFLQHVRLEVSEMHHKWVKPLCLTLWKLWLCVGGSSDANIHFLLTSKKKKSNQHEVKDSVWQKRQKKESRLKLQNLLCLTGFNCKLNLSNIKINGEGRVLTFVYSHAQCSCHGQGWGFSLLHF